MTLFPVIPHLIFHSRRLEIFKLLVDEKYKQEKVLIKIDPLHSSPNLSRKTQWNDRPIPVLRRKIELN